MHSPHFPFGKPKGSPRDQATAVLILLGCAVLTVAAFVWIRSMLISELDPEPANYLEQQSQVLRDHEAARTQNHLLRDNFPRPISPVQLFVTVALVLASFWFLYRIFISFADGLDETGHWNQSIARRHRRKRHRFKEHAKAPTAG